MINLSVQRTNHNVYSYGTFLDVFALTEVRTSVLKDKSEEELP